MFVFTDPISKGLSLGRDALIVAAIADASRGSPAAVPEPKPCQHLKFAKSNDSFTCSVGFKVLGGIKFQACAGISSSDELFLSLRRW